MRGRTRWTEELDARLMALRAARLTWDAIASEMSLGRNTVLERGRKLGARPAAPPVAGPPEEAADRPARPPGHPACWQLITRSTVLDGALYPFPVFL